MIVFLDIDGVLNRHEFDPVAGSNLIEKDLVQNLNKILLTTGAKIVLSSAWRYIVHRGEANLIGMEWLLRSHGVVGQRLIGITDEDTMVLSHYDGFEYNYWPTPNERGKQISTWIKENGYESYVVIDDGGYDSNRLWTNLGITQHPVVWTHSKVGLTQENVDLAIDLLLGKVTTSPDSPMVGTYAPY